LIKDSGISLILNENISKILPSNGWALSQVTCAKMAKTYHIYDITHKTTKPKTKFFFIADKKTS